MEGDQVAVAQAVLGEGKVTVTGFRILEGAGLRIGALFFKGGEGHPATLADGRGSWLRPRRCAFRSEWEPNYWVWDGLRRDV